MTTSLKVLLVSVFITKHSGGLRLPSDFVKCNVRKSDLNPCLLKAIQNAITQSDKPRAEYGLPVVLPKDVIGEYGDENSSFRHKYSFKLAGLEKIPGTSVRMKFGRKILESNETLSDLVTDNNNSTLRDEEESEADSPTYFPFIDTQELVDTVQHFTPNFTYILREKILNPELVTGIGKQWTKVKTWFEGLIEKVTGMFSGLFEGVSDEAFFGESGETDGETDEKNFEK